MGTNGITEQTIFERGEGSVQGFSRKDRREETTWKTKAKMGG
jgi:hypothetical protein